MALPTASDNPFASILITEGSAPASPAAGKRRLYVLSSDHLAYLKDSSGTVVALAGMTNPMTTKGDVIIADTSGVPTRLAAGTSGYVLTAAGAGAFPAWAAASGFLGTLTEATLSGDVTMTTGDTFYDGPTLTPVAGVYDVWARITFGAVSAAQIYFCGRLIANGSATPIDEAEGQWVMANTSQMPMILTARVTADGSNPILVRGTSSNNSQLMKRDPANNSSGLHRATLLRLTRVS